MGTRTDAILAYGYDLGGGDGDWKLAEAQQTEDNPFGCLKTAWYDAEAEQSAEDESVTEIMTRILYEAIPDAPEVEYSFQRERPVREYWGVWFEGHCDSGAPMWILAAYAERADRGCPEAVDVADLEAKRAAGGWDNDLAKALEVLGVHPTQERPGWILASDRG